MATEWRVYSFTLGTSSQWDTFGALARSENEALIRLRLEKRGSGYIRNRWGRRDADFHGMLWHMPLDKVPAHLIDGAKQAIAESERRRSK